MKKILIIAVAALMVLSIASTMLVNAEDEKSLYVNQIDVIVGSGAGAIFTSNFSGVVDGKILSSAGNFRWAGVVSFEPTDTKGVYKAVYTGDNLTNDSPDVVVPLPEGGFIYAAHYDEFAADPTISQNNKNDTVALKVGDLVTIFDINLANGTYGAEAKIVIGSVSGGGETSEDVAVSEEPSTTSEENSQPAEESKTENSDTSKTTNNSSDTSEVKKENDNNIFVYVGIAAAVVIVAIVVVVILGKKKK